MAPLFNAVILHCVMNLLVLLVAFITMYQVHPSCFRRFPKAIRRSSSICSTISSIPNESNSLFQLNERFPIIEENTGRHGYTVLLKFPSELSYDDFHYNRAQFPQITNEELNYCKSGDYSHKRFSIFLAGRIALKHSLQKHLPKYTQPVLYPSVLKNEFGAPILPNDIIGSISHKNNYVAAITQRKSTLPSDHQFHFVGIDIEKTSHKSAFQFQRRILTENERSDVDKELLLPTLSKEADIMLRFSIKESIYKAIHPIVKRYVGFQEVEVFPAMDGSARINFLLNDFKALGLREVNYSVEWRLFLNDYIISSVNIAA